MAHKKKVLITAAKAGAGHTRAAAALEAVFRAEHGDVEVRQSAA